MATISLTNAGTATVPAAQTIGAAGGTLTFIVSNITGDTGAINVAVAAAPQQQNIVYTNPTTTNGVSATLSGAAYAMDGEQVTVTVVLSGAANAATTLKMTYDGSNAITGGAWRFSSPMLSLDASGNLSIANGTDCTGLTAEFTFTVNSTQHAVTGVLS